MAKKTKKDLYQNLIYAVMEGKEIKGYEDSVFNSFFEKLAEEMYSVEYYDPELMEDQILSHIQEKKYLNKSITNIDNELLNLEEQIKSYFFLNKDVHFLICPLQRSVLSEDIFFSNFYFLRKREKEEEFIKEIASCTSLSEKKVRELLTHTKNSRSKDFLKENIFIFKIEDQTDLIKRTAYSVMQDIFNYLRVIYHSVEASTNYFDKSRAHFNKENQHIAILSKDSWRNGHDTSSHSNLQIQLNLDFIKDISNQELLTKMIQKMTLNKNRDTHYYLFYNSIFLFNRALKYENDIDVSKLLLMTTGESLLTQKQNEKRIRLSVILPKLVNLSNTTSLELSNIINQQYRERNDFVHGGRPSFSSATDDKLKQAMAKLIVRNFEFGESDRLMGQKVREKKWCNYVDRVFENSIYGQVVDNK
ncbi:hypothetical protein ACYSNO_03255 [Enterococcus sp. LJL98]